MTKFIFWMSILATAILAILTLTGVIDLSPIAMFSPLLIALSIIGFIIGIVVIPFLLCFLFFGILAIVAFVIELFKD